MVKRQIAGMLLALCMAGCGAPPANQPSPSNFQPVTPPEPAAMAPAGNDYADEEYEGGDYEDEGEILPDETDPATGDEAADPAAGDEATDPATGDDLIDEGDTLGDLLDLPTVGGGGGGNETIPLKNTLFSDWQATGITVSNGQIYITASDRKGLKRRGTILTYTGGKWSDVGATRIGVPLLNKVKLGHKLNNTVRGIAADSMGNITAVEAAGHLGYYAGGKLKLVTGGPSGLLDVVAANNVFYVALGNQIRRYSADLASSDAIVSNLSLTGGMGTDKDGNFYVVSQGNILKITPTGETSTVIGYVTNPVDVAVNSKGHILVLQTNGIKEFDPNGQPVRDIGAGQILNGAAITVDETDRIYVADSGKSDKDSQILAFAAQ